MGNGARTFTNEGVVTGNARFGSGADSFNNDGVLYGRLDMGAGNDVLINRIIASGGADTTGTITGTVDMGDGDDVVGKYRPAQQCPSRRRKRRLLRDGVYRG